MALYAVADEGNGPGLGEYLLFEGVTLVVVIMLCALVLGFGVNGLTVAIITAPIITGAVFWRLFWRHDRTEATAEHGRYYCRRCNQHFQGDSLRQITQ